VTEPDAVMVRIGEGIALREQGERVAAHDLFAQVWTEIGGEDGDPLHVCTVVHSMADVQNDVHEELLWDLRALAAADLLTDERAARGGVAGPVAGFYPSLHLNLAECYHKLGELDQARDHLDRGHAVWTDITHREKSRPHQVTRTASDRAMGLRGSVICRSRLGSGVGAGGRHRAIRAVTEAEFSPSWEPNHPGDRGRWWSAVQQCPALPMTFTRHLSV